MDYRDSPEEAEFRASLRRWLIANVPQGWRDAHSNDEVGQLRRLWHRKLYEAGYMGMSWPVEYGGRGLSPVYEAILNAEVGEADSPGVPTVNYLGRALFTYGTDEQKHRFLPTLLSGEVQWCQGFSEPDAGSDLASLRTKATSFGDHYIVDGQKMWTSGAQWADWCLLLARTDPDVPKHRGITCLLTAMDVPGVSVRPIVMANGDPETCEMFLDNVEVPVDQRIGEEGAGWSIAMTTVSYERGPGDVGFVAGYFKRLHALEALVVEQGRQNEPELRKKLASAYVRGETLRLNVLEQLSWRLSGKEVGVEGSISKQIFTDAIQYVEHVALDVAGPTALTGDGQSFLDAYLASRPAAIYGGTAQVQRNIIAQRLLRMPAR